MRSARQAASAQGRVKHPHVKDDEVEEDEEHVHHDAHDQLQLADHPSRVL